MRKYTHNSNDSPCPEKLRTLDRKDLIKNTLLSCADIGFIISPEAVTEARALSSSIRER